jgi:hypothetical protein
MKKIYFVTFLLGFLAIVHPCQANPLTTLLKEASELISERFGRAGAKGAVDHPFRQPASGGDRAALAAK